MKLKKIGFLGLFFFCLTSSLIAGDKTLSEKVMNVALPWEDKLFRQGQGEQCMNWTREILVTACGEKFKTLESKKPWDYASLGQDEELNPEYANSLASEEFGIKITSINDLKAGDLVFLKNTYGDWNDGVLTHVGIATGGGHYIHRMTSNKGYVKIQAIPEDSFDGAIRLKEELCQ